MSSEPVVKPEPPASQVGDGTAAAAAMAVDPPAAAATTSAAAAAAPAYPAPNAPAANGNSNGNGSAAAPAAASSSASASASGSAAVTVKAEPGAAAPAAPAASNRMVEKVLFWQRLGRFFDAWKHGNSLWGVTDGKSKDAAGKAVEAGPLAGSILTVFGPLNDDNAEAYSRSAALCMHFVGAELNESAFVFTLHDTTLTVVCSAKAAALMEKLGSADGNLKLRLIPRKDLKNAEEAAKDAAAVIALLKTSKASHRVGLLQKTDTAGAFAKAIFSGVKDKAFSVTDVALGVGHYLAKKDKDAISCTTRASSVSVQVMKQHFIKEMETCLDEEKPIKHSKLADTIEDVFNNAAALAKMKAEHIESCYTPIIQSGGIYDLRASATSNDNPMHAGVIVAMLGARYKGYCANLGRTFIVNPAKEHTEAYNLLIDVYTAAQKVMKPGNKLSAAWDAAVAVINAKKPSFMANFTKNVGFGIGLEFREPYLVMDAKNQNTFVEGMTFNLCVGFQNLKRQLPADKKLDDKHATFSVLLADTILITADEPQPLTHFHRDLKQLSYAIDDAGAPPPPPKKAPEVKKVEAPMEDDGSTIATRRVARAAATKSANVESQEIERQEKQQQLGERMRKDALDLIRRGEYKTAAQATAARIAQFQSYKSVDQYPKDVQRDRIFVDKERECLLLPIADQLVPFHINTVKNATYKDDGGVHILQINFLTPGQAGVQGAAPLPNKPGQIYIRELVFRAKTAVLGKVFDDIKNLQKAAKQRIKEMELKATIIPQEKLVLDEKGGIVAKLTDLSSRPQLGGARKRATGTLIAVGNGFRFTTTDKSKIDITYKNIKHAIFQPAYRTSNVVIIHFQLHNPLMIGKKKSNWIQFFHEIGEQSQDLEMKSRSMADDDGLAEEQAEKLERKKWNERCRKFITTTEDAMEKKKNATGGKLLEFDMPYDKQAFQGAPAKAAVTLYPCMYCLVALEDNPPFVLSINDVELASFERIQFNLRNFDLAFVFKDYSKQPSRIDAIPVKYLEQLKAWLSKEEILYHETPINILWKNTLRDIQKDVEGFWHDGGWMTLLRAGDSDAEGEGEDDEDGDEDEDMAEAIAASVADSSAASGTAAAGTSSGSAAADAKEAKKPPPKKAPAKGKRGKKKQDDDDDDSGSEFEPDSDDGDSDESSDYSSDASDDSEDDSDASDDDEEEEGASWEELENKARESDRKKAAEENEEARNRPPPKKRAKN